MDVIRIATIILALLVTVGCSSPQSQQLPRPEEALKQNSCAIRCPDETNSDYAGFAGHVECVETYSPVCQCTDDSTEMAGCELIEQ